MPNTYCGGDPNTGAPIPFQSSGGSGDVDVTKWKPKRINLTIQDVQQSIAEGRQKGFTPFNIGGIPFMSNNYRYEYHGYI
jgi:hypothetical protein